MRVRTIIILLLAALSVLFILQNIEGTTVTFLTMSVTMPKALILTVTLIVGVVIGLFVPRRRRR